MIWTNKFTIGHIGRTGGDATIFLLSAVLSCSTGTAVKLDSNLKVTAVVGDDKHRPFNGSEPIRVLGIRRLPSFILSIRHYLMTYARILRGRTMNEYLPRLFLPAILGAILGLLFNISSHVSAIRRSLLTAQPTQFTQPERSTPWTAMPFHLPKSSRPPSPDYRPI